MGQITVISGVERRRWWSDEEKRSLVAAAFAPDARVAQVAARADVSASLLYRWRRKFPEAVPDGFVPVVLRVEAAGAAPVTGAPVLTVEVGGAVVRVMADAPATLVTAAVRALKP